MARCWLRRARRGPCPPPPSRGKPTRANRGGGSSCPVTAPRRAKGAYQGGWPAISGRPIGARAVAVATGFYDVATLRAAGADRVFETLADTAAVLDALLA